MRGVASAPAVKRALVHQIQAAMHAKGLSKAETARRMHTSRAALYRLLDPSNDAVTLSTLLNVADVLGCDLRLELE